MASSLSSAAESSSSPFTLASPVVARRSILILLQSTVEWRPQILHRFPHGLHLFRGQLFPWVIGPWPGRVARNSTTRSTAAGKRLACATSGGGRWEFAPVPSNLPPIFCFSARLKTQNFQKWSPSFSNDESVNQSINQSTNPSINPSINQSINQSIIQSINQSIEKCLNGHINQSIDHDQFQWIIRWSIWKMATNDFSEKKWKTSISKWRTKAKALPSSAVEFVISLRYSWPNLAKNAANVVGSTDSRAWPCIRFLIMAHSCICRMAWYFRWALSPSASLVPFSFTTVASEKTIVKISASKQELNSPEKIISNNQLISNDNWYRLKE